MCNGNDSLTGTKLVLEKQMVFLEKKVFLLSSLFLYDCYQSMPNKERIETLVYITGVEINQLLVLNKIVDLKLDSQSSVYASGDSTDTLRVLMRLESFGHKLLGVFHIHVGTGIGATVPSTIDIKNQKRMESGRYVAISAIFSSDGYIRFFSNKIDFEVQIYGKGVTKHEDKIYRLELCNFSK